MLYQKTATMLAYFATLLFLMAYMSSKMTSAQTFVNQIRFLVDKGGIEKWVKDTGKSPKNDLERELNSTIYEVNQIYKNLEKFNIFLQFQIKDITILDKNILVNSYGDKIHGHSAGDQFYAWAKDKYNKTYDTTILLTGHKLGNRINGSYIIGIARYNMPCSSYAFAVITFYGTYQDVISIAHEMAHTLGVDHDGFFDSEKCSAISGHIMYGVDTGIARKRFFFSSCAIKRLKSKLDKLAGDVKANCMADSSSSRDITGPRFGSLVTPDELCQRRLGKSSYVSRKNLFHKQSHVCAQLNCLKIIDRKVKSSAEVYVPPTMTCGKNKECVQGSCINVADGKVTTPDSCPFGDQPVLESGDQKLTCATASCYYWGEQCCDTCQKTGHDPGTADEVCRKRIGSHSAMARNSNTNQGNDLCSKLPCLTNVTASMATWQLFQAPDRMKCGKHKRCSNGQCVWANDGDPHMSDSCPFGDQPWLGGSLNMDCPTYKKQNGCPNNLWKKTCCRSCTDPGTADEICQSLVGTKSYMVRNHYKSYGDNLCSKLRCFTDFQGKLSMENYFPAPDGMKCGKDKRCSQGKCVLLSFGDPKMSDTCPYGDQPKIEDNGQLTLCSVNASCYYWKDACCQMCQKPRHDPGTPDDFCRSKVGKADTLHGKTSSMFRTRHGNQMCSNLPCLEKVIGDIFYSKYYRAPNGMKCGKDKICSNGKCVWSSVGDPHMSDTCPYGDQPWLDGKWNMSCVDYAKKYGCNDSIINKLCCGSCSDPGTADKICQKEVGADSYMARGQYSSYGDNLCSELKCVTGYEGKSLLWKGFPTPDGMKCGKNKRCSKGKCVLSGVGDPLMLDSCPYGDQPWIAGDWSMNCTTHVKLDFCNTVFWWHTCCHACRNIKW